MSDTLSKASATTIATVTIPHPIHAVHHIYLLLQSSLKQFHKTISVSTMSKANRHRVERFLQFDVPTLSPISVLVDFAFGLVVVFPLYGGVGWGVAFRSDGGTGWILWIKNF